LGLAGGVAGDGSVGLVGHVDVDGVLLSAVGEDAGDELVGDAPFKTVVCCVWDEVCVWVWVEDMVAIWSEY
jgi:hypothetical protein